MSIIVECFHMFDVDNDDVKQTRVYEYISNVIGYVESFKVYYSHQFETKLKAVNIMK